jgi:hypothetical protein
VPLKRLLKWKPSVALALLFAAQLGYLLFRSAELYGRFELTDDFATYANAWLQIAHGNLNPIDTIALPNYPFIDSHLELAMWPLSLAYLLVPSPFFLLVLQDLAVVASEAIVVSWTLALARSRRLPSSVASSLPFLAALIFVFNPFVYEAAFFDFHTEVVSIPLILATGYCAWCGRWVWAWLFAAAALLFGNVAATYVVAVGVSIALVGGSRLHSRGVGRLHGVGIALAGLALLVASSLSGTDLGVGFAANYSYLAHLKAGQTAGLSTVVAGILSHPSTPIHVLHSRLGALFRYPASAGFLGLVSPLGLPAAAVALLSSGLNSWPGFIQPHASFQNLVAVYFLVLGTGDIFSWALSLLLRSPAPAATLARNRSRFRATTTAGAALVAGSCALLVPVALMAKTWLPDATSFWFSVSQPAANRLHAILTKTPPDAEVIASQGVIGRFAGRRALYPFLTPGQSFPIASSTVMFVLSPDQGLEVAPPTATIAAAKYLAHLPGARLVESGSGVVAYLWHPSHAVHKVSFPT